MIWIGIDPGLNSGAWGAINDRGDFVACGPITAADGRVIPGELKKSLQGAVPALDVASITIEQVFGMPKQGISSTSKFMRATGCIEAVAMLMNYPVHFVTPQCWKKHWNLIKQPKSASLALAKALWPTAPLKLAKHHGMAEALLLAAWGRETFR